MESDLRVAFATGFHGEFSNEGRLPWGKTIKEDMEHYIGFTRGCQLLMGYKTWVSLPAKTKERYAARATVIFTRDNVIAQNFSECQKVVISNAKSALVQFLMSQKEKEQDGLVYCLIGGGSMISIALRHPGLIDAVLHTTVGSDNDVFEKDQIIAIDDIMPTYVEDFKRECYRYPDTESGYPVAVDIFAR